MFVSLPFVVREVIPVLQEIGDDQEQAASTLGASRWQTFWRITLPSIRWGVTYGVILATARALGEFGAVAVVSGRISGSTETLPLYVRKLFDTFNVAGAYAAAVVLALLALSRPGGDELDPAPRPARSSPARAWPPSPAPSSPTSTSPTTRRPADGHQG